MKVRSGLVLALCACAMAFSAPPAFADSLQDLFAAATQSNQDYSMYKIDLSLAELKKTKGEIEAKVDLDRLNAQYAYVSSLAAYRKSVLGFYNQVIDAVFAVATAEVNAASMSLSLENAKEDSKYADSRFKNGLISSEIYKEIDIAYKTAQTSQDFAVWTLKDAKDTFRLVTGLEWDAKLLPQTPAFEAKATADDWVAKDTALQMATLSDQIASLKTAALATNASVYDKKIQETENLRAKVAVSNAQSGAKRSYDSIINTLKNQAAILQIRTDEYNLKKQSYDDALQQYQKGIISLNDKNLRAIEVFTARKTMLAAQQSYIKSIGSYLSAMGENPLGI